MTNIFDVPASELIEGVAAELKKNDKITAPVWSSYVKTGVHKERPPTKSDWWHSRAASVLRRVYLLGPVGTSKLRIYYGGRKNRGYKPSHFYKGSGSIARKLLQQLEKAELIKQAQKGTHKGRVITPKGKSLIDKIASEMVKSGKYPGIKRVKREEKKAVEHKEAEAKQKAKKPAKAMVPVEPKKIEAPAA